MKKKILYLVSCLLSLASFSQAKHKIMIIPFEPKLYMSQIDHRINAETKLTQKQIKEGFRKDINAELARTLKQKYEVLDLLKDTTKYKKDVLTIYKAPVEEKNNKNSNIKNGQILVESNSDNHFMNAAITSPVLVPNLYAKYKTDLFLFVNQLDIMSTSVDEMGMVSERTCTLHYTVFTVDAKEINSGVCSIKFPANVNTPSKISSGYISKIATEITQRITLALSKLEATPKK